MGVALRSEIAGANVQEHPEYRPGTPGHEFPEHQPKGEDSGMAVHLRPTAHGIAALHTPAARANRHRNQA